MSEANAVDEVTRKRVQCLLTDWPVEKIVKAYHACKDIDRLARVVSLDAICANAHNLSIALCVCPQAIRARELDLLYVIRYGF